MREEISGEKNQVVEYEQIIQDLIELNKSKFE